MALTDSPLGKQTEFSTIYNPSILCGIERRSAREAIGIMADSLPFHGFDIWNAYELSWLDVNGKPHVGVAEIHIPVSSRSIVESKSLKLYLASFNQTPFNDVQEVIRTIESDLLVTTQAPAIVRVLPVDKPVPVTNAELPVGVLLDNLAVKTKQYTVDAAVLNAPAGKKTKETVYSHLLRSVCPVTGQPDWASVFIRYHGNVIDHESLLRYIISYRNHADFHEACVERMFVDIINRCKPDKLTVYARFTRRGGIDINPFRSNFESNIPNFSLLRQ